jgi:RNA polymerase sigma-70 factor (ECF subfamily)
MNKNVKTFEQNESDFELVRAFQQGDIASFDNLVIKYKDRIFSLCYSFLKDHEESNDCAQEIFIKIYRSLKGFRYKASLSTWIYRVAVNTCKNRLRSKDFKNKKMTVWADNPGGPEGGYTLDFEDENPSPALELEKKERVLRIHKAIESLPFKLKTVIILRDVQGMSYGEIAKIKKISQGTVKSRISRARSVLREKLRGVI